MVTLERAGLIPRQPTVARSIAVLIDLYDPPELNPGTFNQAIKFLIKIKS